MKIALLSDIHGNSQALQACLAHAREQGVTQIALLGDLVGYGAHPGAVVDIAMRLVEEGAWAVRGNHDTMAADPPADVTTADAEGARWVHDRLNPFQRQFLAELPLTRREQSLLLVHASADAPDKWHYADNERRATMSLEAVEQWPQVRHVFCGHVHRQSLFYRGAGHKLMRFEPTPEVAIPVPRHRHWLATVGSVGQPRDRDPRAMYAVLDAQSLRLWFHRIRYDNEAAAAAILAAGLPAFNAQRLRSGE